jgi:hypothetical protein
MEGTLIACGRKRQLHSLVANQTQCSYEIIEGAHLSFGKAPVSTNAAPAERSRRNHELCSMDYVSLSG